MRASKVFPVPVLPVDGNGKEALGFVLPYDILVEIVFDFLGFGYFLELELFFRTCRSPHHSRGLNYLISLLCAVLTDEAIDARNQKSDIFFTVSTETTCFLHLTFSV